MRERAVLAVALLIVALLLLGASGDRFSGEAIGVIDGDTIDVMRDGRAERVRLNGIDCPERGQAFGTKARERARELAARQVVTIETTGHDRYGHTLGEVTLPDGRSLNRELVREGLAWWFRRYSNDQELAQLEAAARKAKRGPWSEPTPVAPWEFRREKKGDLTTFPNELGEPIGRDE